MGLRAQAVRVLGGETEDENFGLMKAQKQT